MQIQLQDNCFYGDAGCSKMHPPKHFKWNRGVYVDGDPKVVFLTDYCLNLVDHPCYNGFKKIAWLIEPLVIYPHSYEYVSKNFQKFDYILTHHIELMGVIPNALFYPSAMSWIKEEDWKEYNKTKNISLFASSKNFTTGHQIRHQVVSILKQEKLMDVYGTGYNPIDYKLDGLKDYRFSVAIENCSVNHYFTEKLIDCFSTHTIPIYWGCPEINKFFNTDGMIICKNTGEICKAIKMISSCGEKIYNEKYKAVQENFEAAKYYSCAEDWIFQNILSKNLYV